MRQKAELTGQMRARLPVDGRTDLSSYLVAATIRPRRAPNNCRDGGKYDSLRAMLHQLTCVLLVLSCVSGIGTYPDEALLSSAPVRARDAWEK